MKAVILAAGRSVRLAGLTKDRPKCLLNVGERSILDRQIDILNACGFDDDDIFIVVGYKAEQIHIRNVNLVYNHEYYCTDNAHSLFLALHETGKNDTILVLDSDLIFTHMVINQVLCSSFGNLLLAQKKEMDAGGTGIVSDIDGRVMEIGKHIIDSKNVFSGIVRITPDACAIIRNELKSGMYKNNWYTVPLNKCLDSISFQVIEAEDEVYEINTNEDYTNVKKRFGIKRKKILLTGASGLLGEKLFSILKRNFELIGVRKTTKGRFISLDLTDYDSVQAFIKLSKPDIIIHAAGVAEPDICEKDKKAAYAANVVTTQNLCNASQSINAKMVFISTDYVFTGDKNAEYQGYDERRSRNYYGLTKIQAEDIVARLPGSLIVRIPIVYGYNSDFDKTTFFTKTLGLLKSGEQALLDNTAIRYPVLTDEVALAIEKSIEQHGVIQISSTQAVTKADWGAIIANEFGLPSSLIRPVHDATAIAARPVNIKMETSRANLLDIRMSEVCQGTRIVKKQMNCAFKMIYKSFANEKLFDTCVGMFRSELGRKLADSVPTEIVNSVDCVVPVPDSGLYYAMGFAESLKKPYMQALVRMENQVRSFDITDLSSRERIILKKIIPIRDFIENKTIILLDEAIISGTTLKIVCDMLKACNVANVHVFIPTPICFHRCQYYIQPDRQLLSEYINPEDFSDYFGVNTVSFQDYDVFVDNILSINSSACFDCFCINQKDRIA